jgi:predicted alpha/beta-hydrolase family hydrolase
MAPVTTRRFEKDAANGMGVRGYLHAPRIASGDGLVLTHGAGQNCKSPLLVAVAAAFCEAGLMVLRCDLVFRQVRPLGPPVWHGCAESDRQGLRHALDALRKIVRGRVFLGGHSYGGRQSSVLASEDPALVEGLLLLSFPLHSPKHPDRVRTAHFAALQTPALFVHGTRDGFGTIKELTAAIATIPARKQLLSIQGAGHELMTKANQRDLPQEVTRAFAAFLKPAAKIKKREV